MAEKLISVDRMETVLSLFGNYDENVNLIQKEYNVVILGRGDDIKITGRGKRIQRLGGYKQSYCSYQQGRGYH